MKKATLILCATLALVLAVGLAAVKRRQEPSYQSKTLTQWLEHYHRTDVFSGPSCLAAIQAMGTNAVPYFAKRLTPAWGLPVSWLNFLARAVPASVLDRLPNRDAATQRRNEAITMLGFLGTNSAAALPQIQKLFLSNEVGERISARNALAKMHPVSTPFLLSILNDRKSMLRGAAATALAGLGAAAEPIFPAVTEALKNGNTQTAMGCLTIYEQADPVGLPYLVEALNHESRNVRDAARDVLIGKRAKAEAVIPKLQAIESSGGPGAEAARDVLARLQPVAAQ